MTPAERERAVNYLAETRENLLRATSPLSHAQLQFKPAPDRWSVAECLEHVILVENRILGRISELAQGPADTSKRSAFEGRDDSLAQIIAGRVDRFPAPEMLYPSGRWPLDRLLPEFQAARGRSLDLAARMDADLRRRFFPHPVYGDLDSYQWLLLIPAHGERHRAQAEEVTSAPGFPRAAAAR